MMSSSRFKTTVQCLQLVCMAAIFTGDKQKQGEVFEQRPDPVSSLIQVTQCVKWLTGPSV